MALWATSYRNVAVAGHAKRLDAVWCDPWTLASNATNVFAFDDDYSMGILLSKAHGRGTSRQRWCYVCATPPPTSVFKTFPWPDPVSATQREAVAELSRAVVEHRQEICKLENFGLTKLYNLLDEGAYTDLKKLHKLLDEAVAACYGWPKSSAQNSAEIVAPDATQSGNLRRKPTLQSL